jgi:hypothetical protein
MPTGMQQWLSLNTAARKPKHGLLLLLPDCFC